MPGQRPATRRITDEQVREAWTEYRGGARVDDLCEWYGVGRKTLWRYFRELGLRPRGGERFVRREPEMARDAYLQLGQLLAQAGETPGALRYLRLAEQADPGNAGLGCQLAEAYRLCQSAADVARAEASCRAGARPVAPAR